MADARAAEYTTLLGQAEHAATLSASETTPAMRRLRAELRRIRRDYFPPEQRAAAERAVNALHPDHTAEERA